MEDTIKSVLEELDLLEIADPSDRRFIGAVRGLIEGLAEENRALRAGAGQAVEALALAEAWDRCYPGNVNVESVVNQLVAALRGTSARARELEAAEITAEEGQEIIAELTAALAVLHGESLTPCAGGCPGHLGPKASAAAREALDRWTALEAENARLRHAERRFTEERVAGLRREVEAARERVAGLEGDLASAERWLSGGTSEPLDSVERVIAAAEERERAKVLAYLAGFADVLFSEGDSRDAQFVASIRKGIEEKEHHPVTPG